MSANYNLYAGYHELLISKRTLRRPYARLSTHRFLRTAIEAADRYDEIPVIDRDLRREAAAHYFGNTIMQEDLRNIPIFNARKNDIANGLTPYTLDGLKRRLPCAIDGLDRRDVVNYLALKKGITTKKALALIDGKSYGDVKDILMPYIPESEYEKLS